MITQVTAPSALGEMQSLYEQIIRNMEPHEIVLVESGKPLSEDASDRIHRARDLYMKIQSEKELFRALENDGGSGAGH